MAIETLPRAPQSGNVAYGDLRDWLRIVDEWGQLRVVKGANVEEDIGQATDVLHHTVGSPVAIFDDIPGYAPGFRVQVNSFQTHERVAFTLGVPHDLPLREMLEHWRKRLQNFSPIPPIEVKDGPVME